MKNTIDSLTTIIRQKKLLQESIAEQSIESVFNNVILQLKYLIDEKQIMIKSDFSECPTFFNCSYSFKEYFVKYCSNAIKY
jgi:hypothetical protein